MSTASMFSLSTSEHITFVRPSRNPAKGKSTQSLKRINAVRRRCLAAACAAALVSTGAARTASALTFTLTYDANTQASPEFSEIQAATQYVANEYSSDFPIAGTVNILCSEGTNATMANALGESFVSYSDYTYAQVRAALASHINSPTEALAVSTLPATDPTNGGIFGVPLTLAKLLGLSSTADTEHVEFNIDQPFNYNSNNRAVAGEYDFTGTAEHEFSEIMGRISGFGHGYYTVMDLFRYQSNGVRALSGSIANAYFSIDGGQTNINTYNNAAVNGGDYGDWSGLTNDSYNAFSSSGVVNPVSAGDITLMDALGYSVGVDTYDVFWKSPVNGTASTASNWVGGTAPSSSQTAQFRLLGNAYTVSLSGNDNTGGLYVHANSVTVNLSGHTWTLQQTAVSEDALIVGQEGNENGTLSLTNGTLTVNEGSGYASSIAQQANSTGYLIVYSGTTFNNNGALYIGEYGSGEIQCLGGTTNVTGAFTMGQDAGSLGRAALDSGAVLNTTYANIGNYGNAYFYQNGGTHNVGNNLGLGIYGSSSGNYSMGGGNLNVSGYCFVNYDSSSTAYLNQTGGNVWVGVGLVVGTYYGPGVYTLGQSGSTSSPEPQLVSTGAETIGAAAAIGGVPSGTFTQYDGSYNDVGYNANFTAASPTNLYVGNGGNGIYNMYGGEVVVNGTLSIAAGAGSVGVFNEVTQAVAQDYVSVTNETIGDSGNGSMLVSAAENYVSGNLLVANNGTGSLTVTNGSYVSVGGTLAVGDNPNSQGNLNLASGTLAVSGFTNVGEGGTGQLTVGGAASLSVGEGLEIGVAAGAVGQVSLSAGGTLIEYDVEEHVGESGSGSFIQTGGTHTVDQNLLLAVYGSSSGYYELDGGSLTVNGGYEFIGYGGTGGAVFNQSGGSHQVNGQLFVGLGASSPAIYRLSDPASVGTTLTVTGNEIIGASYGGNGSTPGAIFQQSGGTHTVGSSSSPATLTIAQNSGSTASYQLSGGTLNVNGSGITGLMIGGSGNGVFNQSGGTINTNYIAVGNNSTGSFFQSNGTVGNTHAIYDIQLGVAAGAVGNYFLSGGTLNASEEEVGTSGTGNFNQSGGVIQTNYLYVPDYNGKGQYTLGMGTLQSGSTYIGSASGGLFLQTGGSHVNNTLAIIGANGVYNQTGGTLAVSNEELIADAAGSGSANVVMTGGTASAARLYAGQLANLILGAYNPATGNVIIGGSAVFNVSGAAAGATSLGPLEITTGGTLALSGSGRLNLLPHGGSNSIADQIVSLTVSGQGTLDVSNNVVDLPGASLSTITTLVNHGFSNGTWTGAGITSSAAAGDTTHLTALGVIQNNQGGTALYTSSHQFEGITPGASDILVKYTYYGDANLDGKVDGSDYSLIDNGYLHHLTGWYNGDFNYDGVVNGSDYTLIDNTYNQQGGQLTDLIAGADATVADQIAGGSGNASVPEPVGLGLLGMGAAGLLGRRQRRYH